LDQVIGIVKGKSAARSTGVSQPVKGQPLKGHQGIRRMLGSGI